MATLTAVITAAAYAGMDPYDYALAIKEPGAMAYAEAEAADEAAELAAWAAEAAAYEAVWEA